MITMRAAFLLTLGCLTSIVTVARPVSYTGGWTVIEESDRQSSSVLVHYTPAHQWSVGPRVELNRDDDFALYSIRFSQPGSPSAGSVLTIRATSISSVAPASYLVQTATHLMTASLGMVA